MARQRLNDKLLARLRPGEQASDNIYIGLSARKQASGAVSFCLRYRVRGAASAKVAVIGRWESPWTCETARTEAQRLLSEAAQGRDPVQTKAAEAAASMTVAGLVAEYTEAMTSGKLLLKNGEPKKLGTQASDRGRLKLHVLPVVGKITLSELTKQDCERLMHAIADGTTTRHSGRKLANSAKGGKGASARTMTLFAAVLNWGVDRGHIAANPCRGLRVFAGTRKDRHLSDAEYGQLGQALRNPPAGVDPAMVAAIRFTVLSGWRMGEVTGLKWSEVGSGHRVATLSDTKTGYSTRPLSQAAIDVIQAQEQERVPGQALVFPTRRRQRPSYAFRAAFDRVVKAAELDATVTPHVLRAFVCQHRRRSGRDRVEHRRPCRTRDEVDDRPIHAPVRRFAAGGGGQKCRTDPGADGRRGGPGAATAGPARSGGGGGVSGGAGPGGIRLRYRAGRWSCPVACYRLGGLRQAGLRTQRAAVTEYTEYPHRACGTRPCSFVAVHLLVPMCIAPSAFPVLPFPVLGVRTLRFRRTGPKRLTADPIVFAFIFSHSTSPSSAAVKKSYF